MRKLNALRVTVQIPFFVADYDYGGTYRETFSWKNKKLHDRKKKKHGKAKGKGMRKATRAAKKRGGGGKGEVWRSFSKILHTSLVLQSILAVNQTQFTVLFTVRVPGWPW